MILNKILSALAILAAGMTISGCGQKQGGNNVGTMVCDKSFENIIRQEIVIYENVYPKAVIGCQYVTQDEAMERLLSGDTRLAVSSRDLTASERRRLENNRETQSVRSMQIAVDAMALIVNTDNPVDMLSTKEVEKILKGELTNWREIQPDAPDLPITVVVDDPKSGVTTYMREKMIGGGTFNPRSVVTVDSIQGVFNTVKTHRGVIGVIGVSWLTTNLHESIPVEEVVAEIKSDTITIDAGAIDNKVATSGVKTLRIMAANGAFKPLQEYIYSGEYPYTRPIYMITTAAPSGALGKFYTFVTGNEGQMIMTRTGVMPARLSMRIYESE